MTGTDACPAEEAIRHGLHPHEQLLWIGGPDPAGHFGRNDIPVSLVTLIIDFSGGTEWPVPGSLRWDSTGIDGGFGMPRPPVF